MPEVFSSPRRRVLQMAAAFGGTLAAGRASSAQAGAGSGEDRAFAARSFGDALAALGGDAQPSAQITLEVPQIAEDGALVPVSVSSRLPGTREILIVVEGNPQPLAVSFTIPEGTEPYVATRIRMARSATVCAAVRTNSGLYATTRQTQVTVSGCR